MLQLTSVAVKWLLMESSASNVNSVRGLCGVFSDHVEGRAVFSA